MSIDAPIAGGEEISDSAFDEPWERGLQRGADLLESYGARTDRAELEDRAGDQLTEVKRELVQRRPSPPAIEAVAFNVMLAFSARLNNGEPLPSRREMASIIDILRRIFNDLWESR